MQTSSALIKHQVTVASMYVIGSWWLMPLDALQSKAYCTTVVFSHSYLHRQVSLPETLVVKGGTTWVRNGR